MVELRPYQQEAISRVLATFGRGCRRVLLQLPTGAGKTVVASELAILSGIRTGWSRAILISTLCISAGYNVLGFWNPGALWWYNALAVALGVFVPSAIYGLLDTVNRKPPRVVSGAAKAQRAKSRSRGRVVAIR